MLARGRRLQLAALLRPPRQYLLEAGRQRRGRRGLRHRDRPTARAGQLDPGDTVPPHRSGLRRDAYSNASLPSAAANVRSTVRSPSALYVSFSEITYPFHRLPHDADGVDGGFRARDSLCKLCIRGRLWGESFASVAGGEGFSAEVEPLVKGGLSDAVDVGGGGEVVAGGDDCGVY
jgi:hypothetical protein